MVAKNLFPLKNQDKPCNTDRKNHLINDLKAKAFSMNDNLFLVVGDLCPHALIINEDDIKDGVLFFEGDFVNNLIDGSVKFYRNQVGEKVLAFSGTMSQGLLDGPGKLNYESGKRFFQGFWVGDLVIGPRNYGYYENGPRYFEGSFDKDGGKKVNIFYKNGKEKVFTGTTTP